MRNSSCWVAVTLAVIFSWPAQAEPKSDTAFLDRSLPRDIPLVSSFDSYMKMTYSELKISSFFHGVTLLGKMSGKRVELPAALGEWPEEQTEKNWGLGLGVEKNKKIRELFERLCFSLGLAWRYDATRDLILLNPQWQRDDPRSDEQLVDVLDSVKPVPWTALKPSVTPNRVGGHGQELDAWRIAFEALLSKPDNFPFAGTLRVYGDTHGHGDVSPFPVINLFTGKIRSTNGDSFTVVLNGQIQMTNKGNPGDIFYFLFDEKGAFVRGGVYAVADGRVGMVDWIRADGDDGVTVEVGWGSFSMNPARFHLGFVGNDLVLLGSIDGKGKQWSANETQMAFPSTSLGKIMQPVFSISGERRLNAVEKRACGRE